MDLMVTDESPSAISDKMKEILFSKASERVDGVKPLAALSLFGENEVDDEELEDEYEYDEESEEDEEAE